MCDLGRDIKAFSNFLTPIPPSDHPDVMEKGFEKLMGY
jgi:hypothetical protein